MRVRVLKSVSMPPTLLFAPMGPVMGNISMHFCIFSFYFGLNRHPFNPLWMVASAAIIHTLLILWGLKEPHLSTVFQAWTKYQGTKKNLISVKGKNKYVA